MYRQRMEALAEKRRRRVMEGGFLESQGYG
jgi:hypothetical protein